MRGADDVIGAVLGNARRFIPACAGLMRSNFQPGRVFSVHPRMRGADAIGLPHNVALNSVHPRMRGADDK